MKRWRWEIRYLRCYRDGARSFLAASKSQRGWCIDLDKTAAFLRAATPFTLPLLLRTIPAKHVRIVTHRTDKAWPLCTTEKGWEPLNRNDQGVGVYGKARAWRSSFPTLLQQIDYNNPNFVYPNDPRRYRSYFGVISPEDRPLYISSSVSTVAQFRIRDYWMGRCTLKIALPLDRKFASNSSMPSLQRERDWIGFTGAVRLTIWTLEIPKNIQSLWLNPRTLNARTRPSRGRKFAEVYIEAGSDFRSEPFSCKRDSVISFELSCEDCVLDVWQDKQMPPVGLSLEQHFGAQ